ncbi:hypothetical protein TWF481_004492 [Arthrobotrys musiformis]|uniref:Uncharacterized protein n=1 Tax=Arthrobotrys musiformis TaxID=47236 RepID=A0AAV9WLT8_9PEZI
MARANLIPLVALNIIFQFFTTNAQTTALNPTLSPLSEAQWSTFKIGLQNDRTLKDKVFQAQSKLRTMARNCPADRGSNSAVQLSLDPPNSLNILVQGAREVIKLLDSAISSNDPSQVGFGSIEDAVAERAKLQAYLNGVIKFQREFLVAALKYYPLWTQNIDAAQNWIYYAKGDHDAMVVYAAADGPSRRAGLAQAAEDIGKNAIEYINGAAQWAAGSSGNEAFNNLLTNYNPDSADADYTPGTELWREGTGWTEPGSTTDTFTLQALFDKMADWFDCWIHPLPELNTVLQEHPTIPEEDPEEG